MSVDRRYGLVVLVGLAGCTAGAELRLEPAAAERFLAEGKTWEEVGNISKAAEAYAQALDCPQTRAVALTNLGNLQAAHGSPAQAEVLYRQALTLSRSPHTLNNLAWLLVVTGRQWSEAARLAEEAAQGAGQPAVAARCWHTAGLAYGLSGRLEDAIRCLSQAARADTHDDPAFSDQIAQALARHLLQAGRVSEAVDVLDRAGAADRPATSPLTELRWRAMLRGQSAERIQVPATRKEDL